MATQILSGVEGVFGVLNDFICEYAVAEDNYETRPKKKNEFTVSKTSDYNFCQDSPLSAARPDDKGIGRDDDEDDRDENKVSIRMPAASEVEPGRKKIQHHNGRKQMINSSQIPVTEECVAGVPQEPLIFTPRDEHLRNPQDNGRRFTPRNISAIAMRLEHMKRSSRSRPTGSCRKFSSFPTTTSSQKMKKDSPVVRRMGPHGRSISWNQKHSYNQDKIAKNGPSPSRRRKNEFNMFRNNEENRTKRSRSLARSLSLNRKQETGGRRSKSTSQVEGREKRQTATLSPKFKCSKSKSKKAAGEKPGRIGSLMKQLSARSTIEDRTKQMVIEILKAQESKYHREEQKHLSPTTQTTMATEENNKVSLTNGPPTLSPDPEGIHGEVFVASKTGIVWVETGSKALHRLPVEAASNIPSVKKQGSMEERQKVAPFTSNAHQASRDRVTTKIFKKPSTRNGIGSLSKLQGGSPPVMPKSPGPPGVHQDKKARKNYPSSRSTEEIIRTSMGSTSSPKSIEVKEGNTKEKILEVADILNPRDVGERLGSGAGTSDFELSGCSNPSSLVRKYQTETASQESKSDDEPPNAQRYVVAKRLNHSIKPKAVKETDKTSSIVKVKAKKSAFFQRRIFQKSTLKCASKDIAMYVEDPPGEVSSSASASGFDVTSLHLLARNGPQEMMISRQGSGSLGVIQRFSNISEVTDVPSEDCTPEPEEFEE